LKDLIKTSLRKLTEHLSLQSRKIEAVYSPKHRSGQCRSDPKGSRKDTAAYASLSFFTCQRAKHPKMQFPKTTAPHPGISGLSRQPVRETSKPLFQQFRDEPDLGSFLFLVNPAFKIFESEAGNSSEDETSTKTRFVS
jgi:hypothetical protein